MRSFASALVSLLLTAAAPAALAADPKPGGAINIATVGEPPTLDPMVSPADLVGIITQHIFETLYTFDGLEGDAAARRERRRRSRPTARSTRSSCARASSSTTART